MPRPNVRLTARHGVVSEDVQRIPASPARPAGVVRRQPELPRVVRKDQRKGLLGNVPFAIFQAT